MRILPDKCQGVTHPVAMVLTLFCILLWISENTQERHRMATWAGLDSPGTPPDGKHWLKRHVLAGGMLSLSNQSQPEELSEDRITPI